MCVHDTLWCACWLLAVKPGQLAQHVLTFFSWTGYGWHFIQHTHTVYTDFKVAHVSSVTLSFRNFSPDRKQYCNLCNYGFLHISLTSPLSLHIFCYAVLKNNPVNVGHNYIQHFSSQTTLVKWKMTMVIRVRHGHHSPPWSSWNQILNGSPETITVIPLVRWN